MKKSAEKSINYLVEECHLRSTRAGWYDDYDLLATNVTSSPRLRQFVDRVFVASRLALIHSEVTEALEGDRKSLPDDHLPEYPMAHVELADALIRIFDLAGFLNVENLGEITRKKLEYNAIRKDHKQENRTKSY